MALHSRMDGLDVGVAVIAPDWTIAQWSAPAAHLTGIPADRMVGRNFWLAFPAAPSSTIERLLQEVLQDGVTRSFVAPGRSDLQRRVFEAQVTRGAGNHLILRFRETRVHAEQDAGAGHLRIAVDRGGRPSSQLLPALRPPALGSPVAGRILTANPKAPR